MSVRRVAAVLATTVACALAAVGTGAVAHADGSGPELSVPAADLEESLTCHGDLASGDRAPVLLVPGPLRPVLSRFLRRSCTQEFIAPAWSPNGKWIVFTRKLSKRGQLHFQLAMMTAGGGAAGGAPRHRSGMEDIFPAWQPLP